MYKIVVSFLFLLLAQLCPAQYIVGGYGNGPARITETETLDTSELQCVYYHYIYDPEIDYFEELYEILQIGSRYSKYGSYGSYKVDSIVKATERVISADEYVAWLRKHKTAPNYIIKDLKNKNLTVYDKVFIDNYMYEEDTPRIAWQLEDGTEEVCGHKCHKATASFRGRIWTAWYSDIPVPNGPWKFGGLPGLILKIEDSTGEHRFSTIMIKRDQTSFGKQKRQYIKTTREKFNKAILEYKNEAWKAFVGTDYQPKDAEGKAVEIPKRKLFFNPIELE